MDIKYFEALEELLTHYNSDLSFLADFQSFKVNKCNSKDYLKNFKSYLHKSGVARNVVKGKADMLLNLTRQWVDQNNADKVDQFAEHLKDAGITHGKIMTSLASKILYLNSPWTVIPIDNIAKKAFGLKTNAYYDYMVLVEKFKSANELQIERYLATVDEPLSIIETGYKTQITEFKLIRTSRFTEKIINIMGSSER